MVCQLCASGNHDACIARNAGRDYRSCDCQHRRRSTPIVADNRSAVTSVLVNAPVVPAGRHRADEKSDLGDIEQPTLFDIMDRLFGGDTGRHSADVVGTLVRESPGDSAE